MEQEYLVDLKLHHLFSPSKWSHRVKEAEESDALVQAYVDNNAIKSATVRDTYSHECVSYGNTLEERLLWFPVSNMNALNHTNHQTSLPLLIFVHGGYWQAINMLDSCYMAQACQEIGVQLVVLGYELAPKVTIEQQIQQVSQGLQLVLKRAAADNGIKGVYLCGHSAGAQLALLAASNLLAADMNTIDGFVLLSGVYDLRPLLQTEMNKALTLNHERATHLSPLLCYADLPLSRYLVITGEFDSPAFIQQAADFVETLTKNRRDISIKNRVLNNCDHFLITDWLDEINGPLWKMLIPFMQRIDDH